MRMGLPRASGKQSQQGPEMRQLHRKWQVDLEQFDSMRRQHGGTDKGTPRRGEIR
jgi:hypothetical protein